MCALRSTTNEREKSMVHLTMCALRSTTNEREKSMVHLFLKSPGVKIWFVNYKK